jgi:antitoxin component YwqK of YwqJK toxin-antitoxin module
MPKEEKKTIIYTKEQGRLELSYIEWVTCGELFLHREDGPAIERANGSKEWYLNGKLHRIDGPAKEYADGSKEWYLNDKLHRIDGPAIELLNNTIQVWYLSGKQLKVIPKRLLINYMKARDLTPAHLLTDPSEIVRTSAQKYKWKL